MEMHRSRSVSIRQEGSTVQAIVLRRISQFIVSVLLAALLTFGIFFAWAFHKRTRAESLLRSIARLKLGTATFVDAQGLVEKYGGRPWNGPLRPAICSSQNCSLRFVFDNKPLNYVPGVRGVQFVAGIDVKAGYVVSREVDFSTLTASYIAFSYMVTDGMKFTGPENYRINKLKIDARGTPHFVEVNLGPLATADERARAYSIDLSCLARLYGCDSPTAVFPRALGIDSAQEPTDHNTVDLKNGNLHLEIRPSGEI